MSDDKRIDEYKSRYAAAAHAMQTGVSFKMQHDPGETTPKHLRVGVNSAMVDTSAMARLLIDKGLITELEYFKSLCEAMERERDLYQKWVNDRVGADGLKITLG